jgi:hypothetical protein
VQRQPCTKCACRICKTYFLRHLYIKTNILPRQARDKHRKNSKKGCHNNAAAIPLCYHQVSLRSLRSSRACRGKCQHFTLKQWRM